jgi:PIN domain nuclease of toxin-antitoxin system
MAEAVVSAVNLAETVVVLRCGGMPLDVIQATFGQLIRKPVAFDAIQAYLAAAVHEKVRDQGLSLGDCACLALGMKTGKPVLTAEKAWAELDLGVPVEVIR